MTDEPEATRFAILIGGRVAGMVQYSEEPEPDYRYDDEWLLERVVLPPRGRES
jgi:hypothetical protein